MVDVPTRADFLASVVVTAVEGGIDYWAELRNYEWRQDERQNMRDAHVEVREHGREGEDDWRYVGMATVEHGIVLIKDPMFEINHGVLSNILLADRCNDASELDAEDADCIIQAALFGRLVYS